MHGMSKRKKKKKTIMWQRRVRQQQWYRKGKERRQEISLCWLGVCTNNIINIFVVLGLTEAE